LHSGAYLWVLNMELDVTLLTSRILRWLLHFWKFAYLYTQLLNLLISKLNYKKDLSLVFYCNNVQKTTKCTI